MKEKKCKNCPLAESLKCKTTIITFNHDNVDDMRELKRHQCVDGLCGAMYEINDMFRRGHKYEVFPENVDVPDDCKDVICDMFFELHGEFRKILRDNNIDFDEIIY